MTDLGKLTTDHFSLDFYGVENILENIMLGFRVKSGMEMRMLSGIFFNTRFCAIAFIIVLVATGMCFKNAPLVDHGDIMEMMRTGEEFSLNENLSLINHYINVYREAGPELKQKIKSLFFYMARNATCLSQTFALNALMRITNCRDVEVIKLSVEFANSLHPYVREYARSWLPQHWKKLIPEELYEQYVHIREP